VRVKLAASAAEAEHFGRRHIPQHQPTDLTTPEVHQLVSDLFDEAADYVEVVRRLWDSWEDDAEIRDAATGRFIDRNKLHYIDFQSKYLSVKGPSIVPRPPQGQPLISALAHVDIAYRLAARQADIVYVTPLEITDAAGIIEEVRTEQADAGREGEPLHVFADLVVFLDGETESGAGRTVRLDELDGAEYISDARIFTGSAAELADLLEQYQQAGITGFRLRPGAVPDDLTGITDALVPELQRRNLFRRTYEASTLRGLLGLARPANRYTVTEGVPA